MHARLVQLPLSTLGAFGVRIGAAALAYILQIILARSLGAADYGTFSFAWSLVTIGGFLATLGFGQIAVRYLAEYHQRGDAARARGFLRHAFTLTLAGSVAIIGLLYALFPLVEAGYGSLCCTVLAIGLMALPFFAITDLGEGMARSQGWTFRALTPAYIVRTGLMIAGLAIALLAGWRISAEIAILIALLATIGAAALQLGWTIPTILRLFPDRKAQSDAPEWHRAAFPTLLSDLALLARQNIDLIVLGLVAPAATVGIYFAATRIASLIGLVEFAIGAAYGHRFARAKVGGGAEGHTAYLEARRLMRLLGLGGAAVLALLAPLILMLFGTGFGTALSPALILLAGAGIRMAFGPMEDMLQMAGFPADVWRANLIGALVTAILCFLLAGPYQAVGAAVGASIGGLAATMMLALAFRRHASAPGLSAPSGDA
ncbi:MAG: oligosaccharide flippase family protein [Rhizobiales bacterium]|nr:oligosaccharide flippase family protein [Hyphomicrobiales bacterium]